MHQRRDLRIEETEKGEKTVVKTASCDYIVKSKILWIRWLRGCKLNVEDFQNKRQTTRI